jgi:hypothetical protein
VTDVSAGTVMSLAVPLGLLLAVFAWWGFAVVRTRRRGGP